MPRQIHVTDFNLAATLECGQAFRWSRTADGWFTGIVGQRVCRLRQAGKLLEGDIDRHYLGLDVSLLDIVATFPDDEILQQAVCQHWGLRVLRQEPWETLASFIASSTKQIIQIRQIVENLSRRFGEQLDDNAYAFPPVAKIAGATLPQLRACKLGFRAEYLRVAARLIDAGKLQLDALPAMEYERALEELQKINGVGEKIANCTLLFSCGFDQAFPVDVWMQRSLHRLGWRGKKITHRKILNHFGPYAGWAQQYLFYSERSS